MLWVTRGKRDRREDPKTRVIEGLRNKLWEENRGKVGFGRRMSKLGSCVSSNKLLYPSGPAWRIRD